MLNNDIFPKQAVFGAPATINTEKIDGAIDQLNCASNAIYQINGKYDLGDLWFELYFPIVMHTNTIYGCQDEKTQELSDRCVDQEMENVDLTFVEFLQSVRKVRKILQNISFNLLL